MKVLHVITNLGRGGAEGVLFRLIQASCDQIEHVVVSLRETDLYGPKIERLGVRVHALNMPKGVVTLRGLQLLREVLLNESPDVVQTWMYHADLIGGLVAKFVGIPNIIWCIRSGELNSKTSSLSSRLVAYICARISVWLPNMIISCSARAADVHQRLGYDAIRMVIIPNGFELGVLSRSEQGRKALRFEWGVASNQPLLGVVARWDAQKDHGNFFASLSILLNYRTDIRCVLVGSGMLPENQSLVQLIAQYGLKDHIVLAGPRDDISDVMSALDLHILSSSYGEAFPNVVAEAMACGTPCVVTDVGDAALIVGETGWIVPPKNPIAMTSAIEVALNIWADTVLWEKRQVAVRTRIESEFGIKKMVDSYIKVWRKTIRFLA